MPVRLYKYRVVVLMCDDDDGSRTPLGTCEVAANSKQEATQLAWSQLWDDRLTGNFRAAFKLVRLGRAAKPS